MIIKNTSSLSLHIAAAVAIVVVHHLRTPSPPAGHSLSASAAAIPIRRRQHADHGVAAKEATDGTLEGGPAPRAVPVIRPRRGKCTALVSGPLLLALVLLVLRRPLEDEGGSPKTSRNGQRFELGGTFLFLFYFLGGAESRAGFLFQLDSGGIRPQHP